eukprot:8601464-Karenia_brevis.AAC.1
MFRHAPPVDACSMIGASICLQAPLSYAAIVSKSITADLLGPAFVKMVRTRPRGHPMVKLRSALAQ